MTVYPAITIWQPWATLIIEGLKPFEFRGWPAPRAHWGKRVAIHAAARVPKRQEVLELIARLEADGARGQALDLPGSLALLRGVVNNLHLLPLSSVLGLATLGQPLTPDQVRRKWSNDSDRDAHFNFAWPLTDIEPLRPIVPAKGAQGFWSWADTDPSRRGVAGVNEGNPA